MTQGSVGISWTNARGFDQAAVASTHYATTDAGYRTILGGSIYQANAANTLTLTITGLTAGTTYLFQGWVEYQQSFNYAETFTINGTSSSLVNSNIGAVAGGLGQFITGEITMGSDTSFSLALSGASYKGISAMQLRAVPEPGTIALAGLGLGAILLFRRRLSPR